MTRKVLSLRQCRFLGNCLKMEGFEQLLDESPRQFLEHLIRAFKFNIPFNSIHVAQALKRTGKFPSLSLQEAESDVFSGRGGSCLLLNPYLEDFLRSAGFRAHLAGAFNVARSMRRDAFHCSVFVRGVERPEDVFHFDVGTYRPFLNLTDITGLVDKSVPLRAGGVGLDGVGNVVASPIVSSLHMNYQLVNGKHLLSALGSDSRQDSGSSGEDETSDIRHRDGSRLRRFVNDGCEGRRLASAYDFQRIQAELLNEEEDPLVVMVTKDDAMGASTASLSAEPTGVWLPYHIYPTPLRRYDFDIIRNMLQDPSVPMDVRLGGRGLQALLVSGFGASSGEYTLIHNNQCVRVRGSAAAKEGLTARDVAADASSTRMRLDVNFMEDEEEALQLVAEEFPALTDYAKDALDMFNELDKAS